MTIPDCPIVQSAVRVRDETRRDETRRDDARHGATRAMTRASPRKRASENDREAANATRRRPVPPRGRAPPLTPSDIEALNKAGKRLVLALQSLLSRALGRASELSLLRVLASRGCNAAAGSTLGQPWVNPPQASDSLDAIAALFRVSSGVGLCARVSLRGPSRR